MGSIWGFVVRTAATAVALWVAIQLIAGISITTPAQPLYANGEYDTILVFLGVAAIIVLLNTTVKPILKLIGLPLTILTLGLFLLVINAGIFLLAEWISNLVGLGLHITDFWSAVWGALIITVVNWILGPVTGLLGARRG